MPHANTIPPRGIAESLYYSWSNRILGAGKNDLAGQPNLWMASLKETASNLFEIRQNAA